MNGRNRHLQYRRSVYRRRQLRFGLILTVIIVSVLVLVFLIVGNLLHKKNPTKADAEREDTPPEMAGEEHAAPPSVQARTVLLETNDSTTFATRIRALTESGGTAVSIPLNTLDGSLLYYSEMGTKLGYATKGSPTVSISSAMAQIGDVSIHCSGVFYLTAFSQTDPLLRSVELSRGAAMLAEAIQQGLDDVLLLAPAMTAEHTDELLRFVEDIRILAPNASVGLALSQGILTHEQASDHIDRLWNGVDFLALDASEYGSADPVAHATQTVNDSSMMYNRLRYHMRILLPSCPNAETTDAVIAAVEEVGVDSWQILS